jgi:hypothetical protein
MLRNRVLALIGEKPGITSEQLYVCLRSTDKQVIACCLYRLRQEGLIEMCRHRSYRIVEAKPKRSMSPASTSAFILG